MTLAPGNLDDVLERVTGQAGFDGTHLLNYQRAAHSNAVASRRLLLGAAFVVFALPAVLIAYLNCQIRFHVFFVCIVPIFAGPLASYVGLRLLAGLGRLWPTSKLAFALGGLIALGFALHSPATSWHIGVFVNFGCAILVSTLVSLLIANFVPMIERRYAAMRICEDPLAFLVGSLVSFLEEWAAVRGAETLEARRRLRKHLEIAAQSLEEVGRSGLSGDTETEPKELRLAFRERANIFRKWRWWVGLSEDTTQADLRIRSTSALTAILSGQWGKLEREVNDSKAQKPAGRRVWELIVTLLIAATPLGSLAAIARWLPKIYLKIDGSVHLLAGGFALLYMARKYVPDAIETYRELKNGGKEAKKESGKEAFGRMDEKKEE